jgi:hypothetical protein
MSNQRHLPLTEEDAHIIIGLQTAAAYLAWVHEVDTQAEAKMVSRQAFRAILKETSKASDERDADNMRKEMNQAIETGYPSATSVPRVMAAWGMSYEEFCALLDMTNRAVRYGLPPLECMCEICKPIKLNDY